MTKKIFAIILFSLFSFSVASAETINLSSKSSVCNAGEAINVSVGINSQSKVYTVKASVMYSKDTVSFRSFAFAPGWMPLSQPGYDSVDEKLGKIIKTAGYPGGINGNATLGTVTFVCNQALSIAEIGMLTDSVMLNDAGKDVYNEGNKLSISVTEAGKVDLKDTPKKDTIKPKTLSEIIDANNNQINTQDSIPAVVTPAEETNNIELPARTSSSQIPLILSIVSMIISCAALYIAVNSRRK